MLKWLFCHKGIFISSKVNFPLFERQSCGTCNHTFLPCLCLYFGSTFDKKNGNKYQNPHFIVTYSSPRSGGNFISYGGECGIRTHVPKKDNRISSAARYNHFDNSPYLISFLLPNANINNNNNSSFCQPN